MGFTLVELLVVTAIIGVLVGLLLLLPAEQAARPINRSNNFKQIGVAIMNGTLAPASGASSRHSTRYENGGSRYRATFAVNGSDSSSREWRMPRGTPIHSPIIPPHFPFVPSATVPVTPEKWPHAYDHSEPNKRCIFSFDGIKQRSQDSVALNGGAVIPVHSPDDIANGIRQHGCCEILISGRASHTTGNPGGTHIGWPNPRVILPSFDGSVERDIRDALIESGYSGCSMFMYICGGPSDDPLGPQRDEQRQRIADATGCDVYGAIAPISAGLNGAHSPCKQDWGRKCDLAIPAGSGNFPTVGPVPFIRIPRSDDSRGRL